MPDYPQMIAQPGRVEPVPRRIRAVLGGVTILDTTSARYLWESPRYPFYYLPLEDFVDGVLVDEDHTRKGRWGTAQRFGLKAGGEERSGAGQAYTAEDAHEGLAGTIRLDWAAVDAWYEEDEQVFVHPRNPYTRVDAIRSTRTVRVELEGLVLAESAAPVMVFETGLPTRYYLDRTAVDLAHLVHTDTETECPYKGTTSDYWSVRGPGGAVHDDLAWAYDFPTRQLLPITGLVAFLNEKLDIFVDGQLLERPTTPFS